MAWKALVGTNLWGEPFKCGINTARVKIFVKVNHGYYVFFDQIRFYEVSHEELMEMREAFPRGKMKLNIEETTFSLKAYKTFLKTNEASIHSFISTQRAAFEEERLMWEKTGLANFTAHHEAEVAHADEHIDLSRC